MSRKVWVRFNWSDRVLLTLEDAKKVSDILDGASVVQSAYYDGELVYWLEDEGYVTQMDFADPKVIYKTQEAAKKLQDAEEAKNS